MKAADNIIAKQGKDSKRTSAGLARLAACFAEIHLLGALGLALALTAFVADAQVTANTPVFGPQTYTRTTGPPNQYTTTFSAPAWVVSPYDLHIVNGDASGNNRMSSATITLNGVEVAGPSDFNQNVATIDKAVILQANNTLQVSLASKPGSYITIDVAGTNGDHTPPQLTIVSPASNAYINTTTPGFEITYSDPAGQGEPGASGVNTSTLQVSLDGVDRTSLFTVRSGDASATLPSSLALTAGPHTLNVSIADNAGNTAQATAQFTVDLSPPQIQILQPVAGSYLNTTTPTISIQYSDNDSLNLSSLKILVNNSDLTSLFTKTSTSATLTLSPTNALPQGANQIVAQVQDLAGNQASASDSFNVDTTPPTISITHPTAGSYHASGTVEFTLQFSDDQAINASTVQLLVDGAPVGLSLSSGSATGSVSGLADGSHSAQASVKDQAGNLGSTQLAFYVDSSIPSIHIIVSAPNGFANTPAPSITVQYSDDVGVDTTTLQVSIDGANQTALLAVGPASATIQAGQVNLPQGTNTITAQISNLAGVAGGTTFNFAVDSIPPAISIQSPPTETNQSMPVVTIAYSDAVSGVNPTTLKASVDGADITSYLAAGASSATGVVNSPLPDGTHQISATVADLAGNVSAAATRSFVVDTKPPAVTFASPANNSFSNNPTPSIVLQYNDGTGTGVDTNSIRILLQQGANPATDITSYFQIGPQQAIGAIPSSNSLSDGTYVLSAIVSDAVGNTGSAQSTFVIDTVPPTGSIVAPPVNGIFNSGTVAVVLQYQDDNSGVDTTKLVLTVDGVNQTSALAITPTGATGTLPTLADGTHTIQLTIVDRAGNTAPLISQTFITDTVAPTITASVTPAPNAAGWNNTPVTVTFSCADSGSGVSSCTAPVAVSSEGANQSTCGQAVDAAGNTSSFCARVSIDETPPTITASVSPAPNANGIITTTPVTITFACSDALSGVASCPSPLSVTTTGLNQVFTGTAKDIAGNSATTSVTVNIQTAAPIPPSIAASAAPPPNAKGWNNTNVTVSFSCTRGTYPIQTCPSPIVVSQEGAGQPICGKAIDATGLSASACATVSLDKTPPTITATAAPPPNSNGWNTTSVSVTFNCSDALSGVSVCPPPQQVSAEGANQVISGTATDNAGNTSVAQVTLNIEINPPAITGFTAPAQLSPGQSGTATLTATDDIGVTSVVFQLNGAAVATLTAPPFTTTFTAPTTANAGDTLTLTAIVSDPAGNAISASRGIQVVNAGVVVGQIISDLTGLPLPGATVQVAGGTGQDTSDNNGRYSIPVTTSHLFLTISMPGNPATNTSAMVPVEREVFVQPGVGTVPVDARMTQVAAARPIGPSGGTVGGGSVTVNVPAGGVSSATNFYLTLLSQQGIPALLPLGWSPIAAFDLRTDTPTSAPLSANFTVLPSVALNLATYNYNVHAWIMVAPSLSASKGALSVALPSTGSYALVTPDPGNTAIQAPSAGQPITGVPMVAVPTTATTTGGLSPTNVSPAGGTSTASLALQSPTPLPSGTVLQAKVTETYSLASGPKSETAPRFEDIVVYQVPAPAGAAAAATFPVTPSQTFQPEQITSGDVHLDILAGRESVRGQIGGSDAVSVQNGGATLTVPGGSLPQDTAIAVSPEAVDGFLPSTPTLTALAEYNLDFSGQVLNTPAQLTVPAGNTQSGATIVLALEQRVGGVPFLVVVSLAQVNGSNLATQATPGFPGITQGGDYVFYQLSAPIGFVTGTVTASSGPVAAMVQTDGLPFVAFSSFAGSYTIPAAAGTVNLTASVPNTALAGTASVQVTAAQTATANITVVGQVESATVTPPNGAVGVPLTAEIDITAHDAFNPATVSASSVTLTQTGQGGNTPIPVRFVFSQGGAQLAVFPQSALQPSTTYTLSASGLANVFGGLIAVPTVSFTTQAVTPPTYNTDALVFSMPDANGNVQITAPPDSFPPGSSFLIVDETNGVVLTLTVNNDGSVSGQMPATINDLLQITLTDPGGNKTTFTRSSFVAPDGTVAVGPGGATVTGPNGTAIIIPAGALDKGATFKLGTFPQTALPDMPDVNNLQFATGLTVQTSGVQKFNKEVKLVFPVPANATSAAHYYVYRRVVFADGTIGYEVIDEAMVQGTGSSTQVVTASPPFPGYQIISVINGIDTFLCTYIDDPSSPGLFTQGAITGKVLGSSFQPGSAAAVATGIAGARVYTNKPGVVSSANRQEAFATSQSDGTYVLWDPNYQGGPVTVFADMIPSGFLPPNAQQPYSTNAFEILSTDSLYTLLLSGLLGSYRNVAFGNITVPPPAPPQPPPAFMISVVQDNNGTRTPTSGIVTAGASLIIGVNPQPGSIQGVGVNGTTISVNGQNLNVGTDTQGQFAVISTFVPATPDVYTIIVTVANAFGGPPTTASNTFRAIGAGGSGITTTPGRQPMILTDQTYPTYGSLQVPIDVNPLITFSEPVTIPAGSVQLQDSSGNAVSLVVAGVDMNGNPYSNIFQAPAGTAFISITIQPLQNLKYSTTYEIMLSQSIQDLNQPPFSLVPGSSPIVFGTYSIPTLSTGGGFASPGIFVARNRAYVAEINPSTLAVAQTWQFNVSNPASPTPIAPANDGVIEGRADYVTGEDNSVEAAGKTLIAVAVAPYPLSADQPGQTSHVMLYKGTSSATQGDSDSLTWIGAVSLTSGALDGTVSSIAVQGNRLYASTIRKGIQVVDLDQVMQDFQGTLDTKINFDINTAGQGFATDAVIATIGVQSDPTIEYLDDLLAIKVANYPAAGGQNQTLAVATGSVPSAPGSSTGVSFVVADPNAEAIVSKTTPQSSAGSLIRGVALALGPIQTGTAVQNIAAVVGDGTTTSCGSCEVLTVMDMTTPANPQPLSFVALTDIPTDVILKGNDAIVAYADDAAEVFDLSNPASPVSLGLIQGVGGKLFLYNGSELFSTGAVPGNPTSSLGGVHAAVLTPAMLTNCGDAILAVPVTPGGSSSALQTALTTSCSIQVLPLSTPASTASLSVNGAVVATGVTLNNGGAIVQIPAGTPILGGSFNAQSSAKDTQTNTPIPSFQQTVPVGTVTLIMDFNNDTNVDEATDLPLKNTNAVALWASDRTITGLAPRERLLDYLTVRVKASIPWTAGIIQLQLKSNFADEWYLADKLKPGLTYLQNDDDSTAQDNLVGQPCQFGGAHPQSLGGECVNVSLQKEGNPTDFGAQPLPNLSFGDNEFLFRCEQCPRQFPGVSAIADRTLQLVARNSDGSFAVLDQAKIDIRLFKEWATVYNVRSTATPQTQDDYRPTAVAQLDPGWTDVPFDVTNVTVLVHGFHTSQMSAETDFVPTMAKRLYWAGQPILDTGQNDAQGNSRAVGFAWPGDDIFPAIITPAVDSVLFFPEDEMHALESGVPLAKFLVQLKSGSANRTVNVIAHSLGNMVVNSALSRPELPPSTVKNYIMYDAAVPVEAFGSAFTQEPSLLAHAQFLGYDASPVKSDSRWQNEWSDMQNGIPDSIDPGSGADLGPNFTDLDNWCAEVTAPDNYPATKPRYELRWLQTRPAGGILDEALPATSPAAPCNVPTDRPQRGPWQGFFAGNLRKTNIINAYNTGDVIVTLAWRLMQLEQKPNYASKQVELAAALTNILSALSAGSPTGFLLSLLPTQADDVRSQALWGKLPFTTSAENSVFGDGQTHSNMIRQWAELSQWYPSLTDSVGVTSTFANAVGKAVNDDTNLTSYGSLQLDSPVATHTYLYERSYSKVWQAFSSFKTLLQ